MKFALLSAALLGTQCSAATVSPIGKVIEMLSGLQAKIISEGENAQKVYAEYAEWCEDRARDLTHEIKTGKAEVESLEAVIAQQVATEESLNAKIDELSGGIAKDEADLAAATHIREKENADFVASETELVETVDMLGRAIGILEREMAKGGAAMLQLQNVAGVSQALTAMVAASLMSSTDASKLSAFVQTSQGAAEGDDDAEPNAPAAQVYEGHSGDIINTLEGLKDKADEELDDLRKTEIANHNNFQSLKQALEDEIKFANQDLTAAKKNLAESMETKAKADGELQTASADLAEDIKVQGDLHQSCMTKAQDFEAETNSRGEELKALAEAKKAVQEKTAGAEELSYGEGPASFVQTRSRLSTGMDLAHFEAVRIVRSLAAKHQSSALAQLAQRMGAAMRSGVADPFEKVKGLISDMITKLEADAEQDATHKAYCDKELGESEAKKADKEAEINKQTVRIDEMASKSSMLKEDIARLQAELAALAKSQVDMEKLRETEHTAFVANKADLEQGLEGVKIALKVLKEYYAKEGKAHTAQSESGSGIIGLLEVIESDFSKGLAEIETAEETAATDFDRETKDNSVEKTTKEKDVEYKQKETVYLDQEIARLSEDRSGVQAELDAVNEYLSKLHKECDEVAETYADRKARYDAEIAGLKEALATLESETALLQRRAVRQRRALRGQARLAAQ